MNQLLTARNPNPATSAKNNIFAGGAEAVLAYEHEGVVLKLMKNHGMAKEKAESVWMDTKRFLYLCGWKDDKSFSMTPTADIDKGWHEFILFTREYRDFCVKNFGEFIHHEPNLKSLKDSADGSTCSEEGCTFGSCREIGKNSLLSKKVKLSDCRSCQSGSPGEGECGEKCESGCKSAPEPNTDGGNISVKNDTQETLALAKKVFGELSDNWTFIKVKVLDCSGTTNCQHNCRNCNVPSQ